MSIPAIVPTALSVLREAEQRIQGRKVHVWSIYYISSFIYLLLNANNNLDNSRNLDGNSIWEYVPNAFQSIIIDNSYMACDDNRLRFFFIKDLNSRSVLWLCHGDNRTCYCFIVYLLGLMYCRILLIYVASVSIATGFFFILSVTDHVMQITHIFYL
jgi:hypothetical protein